MYYLQPSPSTHPSITQRKEGRYLFPLGFGDSIRFQSERETDRERERESERESARDRVSSTAWCETMAEGKVMVA
jgi:hypothetical protein